MGNTSPTDRVWAIWMEGFLATGMEGKPVRAHLVANVRAPTFEAACMQHYANNPNYHAASNTYWGCRLFDNEAAAREAFG